MADDTKPKISEKQEQVLKLHKEGKNATEIAKEMGIKSNGVHAHIRRLRAKGLIPKVSGSRKSGSTRKSKATTTRNSRRASSPRSPRVPASVKALEQAKAQAAKRVEQIDAEIAKLTDERNALVG